VQNQNKKTKLLQKKEVNINIKKQNKAIEQDHISN
jgi:hypothetical protein